MNSSWARDLASKTWKTVRTAVASDRARRYRAYLFQIYILGTLLFFALLALLANVNPYLPVDLLVTRELQTNLPAWVRGLMVALSWPGWTVQAISIVLLTVIFLAALGLHWEAVSALFAAVASQGINYLVKVAIRRPRPSDTLVDVFQKLNSYSFPSGHVMFYVGFFGFLLFLTFVLLKSRLHRIWISLVLLFLMIGVGFSRMWLGEHWASDVIGGYLLGSLTLILSIRFYQWGKKKILPVQPVASEGDANSEPQGHQEISHQ
jgi:membrane-associated phospholipid phosphatase